MRESFGDLVHNARKSEGISLRELGLRCRLSVPYIHDVEHDRRRLAVARWAELVAALPSLTLEVLASAALASGTVELDVADLTSEQRTAIAAALVRQASTAHRVAA